MYKKIFLTLMTTLVVCQSATAGFFKKQDPKEQLKAAVNASSYSKFAATFKENYQPITSYLKVLGFDLTPVLSDVRNLNPVHSPAKFDFSLIKDEISRANGKKLTKLKKEKKSNYNIWMTTKGLAASAVSFLGLKSWIEMRYWAWPNYVDTADKVAITAGLALGAYGVKQVYNGSINYKSYIQNKIDQQEKIKTLIEPAQDE